MMKSIFKGMFVLAALALPTTINAQKLHYNASLETSHLWRGLEVSKGLTFNNEFAISDNNNHFRLGAWGGMQVDGDYKEADIYASYTIGGFSVAVWDIYNFSDGIYANDKQYRYFNYDARTTGHFLDAAISYNFAQHGLPLSLSWATVLAGRDRGNLNKQNIYSTFVQAAYTFYEDDNWKVDASVGGNFALSNYDENDGATFYGKSAGVNDVRLGCTYKLKVGKANLPITSQMMWNPEANKGYFRVAINLLDI